jgi:hypothetical protein
MGGMESLRGGNSLLERVVTSDSRRVSWEIPKFDSPPTRGDEL